MPKIDDGSADQGAGRPLKTAWVTLSAAEAHELLASLQAWAEDLESGHVDPQWHPHIAGGTELSIAIETDQHQA